MTGYDRRHDLGQVGNDSKAAMLTRDVADADARRCEVLLALEAKGRSEHDVELAEMILRDWTDKEVLGVAAPEIVTADVEIEAGFEREPVLDFWDFDDSGVAVPDPYAVTVKLRPQRVMRRVYRGRQPRTRRVRTSRTSRGAPPRKLGGLER